MPALRARRLLREKGSSLTPESLRELILEATGGDADAADQAYCERVLETEGR